MQYRQLGHSSLHLSAIGLGTMTWGKQNTQAEAFEQMDYALEQGINFFDTAEMYPVPAEAETTHETERIIGNWLQQRSSREKIILATKAAGPGRHMQHIRQGPKLNQQHLTDALEGSLQRLKTDVIDLYQIHWPARNANYFGKLNYRHNSEENTIQVENTIRETLLTLNRFIQAGKIRYYGISNETPWGLMSYLRIAQELNMPTPASIQNPYSLLNRSFEVGLAEICHRENIGLLAYSPLAFGMLTGKYHQATPPADGRLTLFPNYQRYTNDTAKKATAKYCQLAQQHQFSPAELALQFVTQQPFVTSNLIGATSLTQLTENINSINKPLSAELLEQIEEIFQAFPNPAP